MQVRNIVHLRDHEGIYTGENRQQMSIFFSFERHPLSVLKACFVHEARSMILKFFLQNFTCINANLISGFVCFIMSVILSFTKVHVIIKNKKEIKLI